MNADRRHTPLITKRDLLKLVVAVVVGAKMWGMLLGRLDLIEWRITQLEKQVAKITGIAP